MIPYYTNHVESRGKKLAFGKTTSWISGTSYGLKQSGPPSRSPGKIQPQNHIPEGASLREPPPARQRNGRMQNEQVN
ncbi:hypothetical protein CEXT_365711 [Caerostris extrusa]|uniref:Uncharacterized protein n=1 Tax=Caerostris extrusa TaxID=172846 RepID=A0AAV4X4C2_CAEEX|nr:hypothetical protein CEXT_365711 [Caerostris extrusa]